VYLGAKKKEAREELAAGEIVLRAKWPRAQPLNFVLNAFTRRGHGGPDRRWTWCLMGQGKDSIKFLGMKH